MSIAYNMLTNAESERLHLVIEECGEVIQACTKILRHGYESVNPDDQPKGTNRKQLEREIGDLFGVINLMAQARDVKAGNLLINRDKKLNQIKKYLHHQKYHHKTGKVLP